MNCCTRLAASQCDVLIQARRKVTRLNGFFASFFVILLCLAFSQADALTPDQLLLITNANSLEGTLLVSHYCKVRDVPTANVIPLKLPLSEVISFDDYERLIAAPVSLFLREHHLENRIKCLVTFYGMPIRIEDRRQTPAIAVEQNTIHQALAGVQPQLETAVANLEKIAEKLDSKFNPPFAGTAIEDLIRRADIAGAIVSRAVDEEADEKKRSVLINQLIPVYAPLIGIGPLVDRMGANIAFRKSPAGERAKAAMAQYRKAQETVAVLRDRAYDPSARQKLRELIKDNYGLLEYARLLQGQMDYLQTTQSGAAVDNELPLVLWRYYPRTRWLINPFRYDLPPAHFPPAFMVMRIDAPTAELAKRMIDDSIATEKTGLHGKLVIDAQSPGGAGGGYAECDLELAQLASLVKTKTHLTLIYDDKKALITRRADDRIKDVAVYCGWYSPEHYVPAFDFVPGSVGYHIASFTMTTLHNLPGNWCEGLMRDGMDATLGPCAEPYLAAFPNPDEFFPLLLTGKLPLAEVYWKTAPMTSWMISMIGDPLYTPFKNDPALSVSDLPAHLRRAITQAPQASGR